MLSLVAPPQVEPVSVEFAKRHIGVFGSSQDDYIGALVAAARERAENICERAFVAATWERRVAEFSERIRLYRTPIASIESMSYRPAAAASLADRLEIAAASLAVSQHGGHIEMASGASWPDGSDIIIRFTTGPIEMVPSSVCAAICMIAADLYNNREESVVGTTRSDNPAVMNLLSPFMLGDRV
jgi:uncharacterized phiE125 gp8 family phage protein